MQAADSIPTLPFLVVASEPRDDGGDSKRLFGRDQTNELALKEIPVDRLQTQLRGISEAISQLLEGSDIADSKGLRLREFSVQVEITATGGINLIGTATVGATAAMTLTFSR